MRAARLIMGMPIEIEIVGEGESIRAALEDAFAYFTRVDEEFSTYKESSAISRIDRGELSLEEATEEMRHVFALAKAAKEETKGYFDIRRPDGHLDPSGIVKGWAIEEAAAHITAEGFKDFFVNAGGDIASSGHNADGEPWSVGIKNPFAQEEIVKVVYPRGRGIATSGSYVRGAHIYDPHDPEHPLDEVKSVTVIAPSVMRADMLATAAFAMGREGIAFLEGLPEVEGYQIDTTMTATMTSGFGRFMQSHA